MSGEIANLYATIGANTTGLENGLKRSKTKLKETADESKKLSQRIGEFAKGFTKFAVESAVVSLGAAIMVTISQAAELETTFSRIAGLTDTPRAAIAGLRDETVRLSIDVGKSANELAKGLYFISSSGYQGAEAMDILNASAKAAAAGLGDTQVIADAVTSALNAYQLGGKEAARVTDILVQAVKEGKGEPDALAGALGRVLPVAAAAGVNMEQVAASLAVMTRTGLSAEEAATALRGTIGALLAPAKQSVDALAEIGLTTDDVAKMLRSEGGLVATLDLLMKRTGGNIEQLDAIIPNVRALTGVLSSSGSQAAEYARILGSMENAAGATDEAFKAFSETLEFKVGRARSSIEAMGDAVAQKLLPPLGDAADAVTTIVTWNDRLNEAFEGTRKKIESQSKSYEDYRVSLIETAVAAGKLSRAQADQLLAGERVIENSITQRDITQRLVEEIGLLTEGQLKLKLAEEQSIVTAQQYLDQRAEYFASLHQGAEAASYQAVETEKAAKAAAKLAEKVAETTVANLDFVESFKEIDTVALAREELRRLGELMKTDPDNIDFYKKKYEELQLEFGFVTKESQAASEAFEILSQMQQNGQLTGTEFRVALELLDVAAKDGKVSADELGLSASRAGEYMRTAAGEARTLADEVRAIPTTVNVRVRVSGDVGDIADAEQAAGGSQPNNPNKKPSSKPSSKPPNKGGHEVGMASGGLFRVPIGFPNDTFPLRVQTGEVVAVAPRGQQIMRGGDTYNVTIADGHAMQMWLEEMRRRKVKSIEAMI